MAWWISVVKMILTILSALAGRHANPIISAYQSASPTLTRQIPTHTQVGKDDHHHPLQMFASELAIYRVNKISKAWNLYDKNPTEANKNNIISMVRLTFQHPMKTNEYDGIAKNWANKNPKAIKDAQTSRWQNLKLDAHETVEVINDKLKKLDKNWNSTIESANKIIDDILKKIGI